jgi:methionine-rich copper-binding protein CopC
MKPEGINMQIIRKIGIALSSWLILSALSFQAFGHSALKASFPAKGSEIDVRPDMIALEFNGPVRLVKFELTVDGDEVSTNFSATPEPEGSYEISVGGSGVGKFMADFSIVGADGHLVRETLNFSVK